jgi:endonuclease YncB( thermonuclease family)
MIAPSFSVCAGLALPKPAREHGDNPNFSTPNVRAIKALGMGTGAAASALASRPWRKVSMAWALLFGLLLAHSALAETILGRVVGVSDGDTITVLTRERKQIKVRLASIDAPEKSQPFGERAKKSLSDLCFGKDVRLEAEGEDRYGRIIATVYVGDINANAAQVWRGMAWVFDRYAPKDSPLFVIQGEASKARRGLWRESSSIAPWEWRRQKRSGELE